MTDIQTDTLPGDFPAVAVDDDFVQSLPGADVPEWARALNLNLELVHLENRRISSVHDKILGIVEELKPEVLGVVESLRSNPMFKMLLGGKK